MGVPRQHLLPVLSTGIGISGRETEAQTPGLGSCPSQCPAAAPCPVLSAVVMGQDAQLPANGRILHKTFLHWGFWQGRDGGTAKGRRTDGTAGKLAWVVLEEQILGPLLGQSGSKR